MKLFITREIIRASTPCNPSHCVLAQAVRYQKGASSVAINADVIRFNIQSKGLRYVYTVPPIAVVKIREFDKLEGQTMEERLKLFKPFEITLRNPFTKPIVVLGPRTKPRKKGYKIKPRQVGAQQRRFHGVKVIRDARPSESV